MRNALRRFWGLVHRHAVERNGRVTVKRNLSSILLLGQVRRRLTRQPVSPGLRLAVQAAQVVDRLQQLLAAHLAAVTPQPLHEHLRRQARFDH